MNNATLSRADRVTHLKVVVLALAASVAVLSIAVAARVMPAATLQTAHGPVVKAGKTVVTTNDVTTIR